MDLRARQPLRRAVLSGLVGFALVALLIQAVPYGRDHTNPAVVSEPPWDTPRTRELAAAACFDCHSNAVHYPWYSNVAPFSWAIQRHVGSGRRSLNFSEWSGPRGEVGEAAETVLGGSMPPFYYRLAHAAARLDPGEKQDLADGLTRTFGGGGN